MNIRLIFFFLTPLLFAATLLAQELPSRGPYLQKLTDSSVTIKWRSDSEYISKVYYDRQSGLFSNEAIGDSFPSVTKEHSVTLSGLEPDAIYHYAIEWPGEEFGLSLPTYTFRTAPLEAVPTRFWVLGDSGDVNSNSIAVRDAYSTYAANTRPADFLILLGDNAYNNGTDGQYQTALFDMHKELLPRLPMWSTLGNHDGRSASSLTQTGVYYDIFDFPKAGEAGGLASGTEAYYSFNYANIHFISLNSYDLDRSSSSSMLTWLAADLAVNDKEWLIAFWHHPPYSKGSHDSDSELELIEMRENVLPLLEQAGVDLVLTGHSHAYERSFLIDSHYDTSDTLVAAMIKDGGDGKSSGEGVYQKPSGKNDNNKGAVYTVAGSSSRLAGGDLDHPVMITSLREYGSVIVDVSSNRLSLQFLNMSGKIKDSFEIVHPIDASSNDDFDLDGVIDSVEIMQKTNPLDRAHAITSLGNRTCVEWNGFLGMFNFLEQRNAGSTALSVKNELFGIDGSLLSEKVFSLEPSTKWDQPVHDMLGFSNDSYGVVCVTHSGGDGDLQGQMLFYKPDFSFSSLQFAFALSLGEGKKEKQFVSFNTFQPSFNPADTNNKVVNWVQITNIGNSAGGGVLTLYDRNGKVLIDGEKQVFLAPRQRQDIAAHRSSGQEVGLAEFRPNSSDGSFLMRNIRYYYDNSLFEPSFSTAIQMTGDYGTGEPQFLLVDTIDKFSVAEITNTLAVPVSAQVKVRNADGQVVLDTRIGQNILKAKSSFHLIVNEFLPSSSLGSVEVQGSEPNSLYISALHYSQDESKSIKHIYSIEAGFSYERNLKGSYNTFIDQDADLVLLNTRADSSVAQLELFDSNGSSVPSGGLLSAGSFSRQSRRLNDFVANDTYGAVSLEPNVPGSFVAWILRNKSEEFTVPIMLRLEGGAP